MSASKLSLDASDPRHLTCSLPVWLEEGSSPDRQSLVSITREIVERISSLRFQDFLLKLEEEWPPFLDVLHLRSESSSDGDYLCADLGAFPGHEDDPTVLSFEAEVLDAAWTNDNGFMKKLEEAFVSGQKAVRREDLAALRRKSLPEGVLNRLAQENLNEALPPAATTAPPRPRM